MAHGASTVGRRVTAGLALVVLSSAVVLGAAPALGGPLVPPHHIGSGAVSPHANMCRRSKIDVPACGVLWGLYARPVPYTSHWVSPYRVYEKAIGRRFDIVKRYSDWKKGVTFPDAADRKIAGHGKRILDFSWNAINYTTNTKVSYQSISDGDWDKSVILPEARRLKAFHHKVFLDFDHEFDNHHQAGKGTAAQYVAAYRHIYRVLRRAGVKNVIWTWVSTGYLPHLSRIKAYYPGSRYVDWVGYDPYNSASCRATPWRYSSTLFTGFYRWLRRQRGMKHKPIMLAEYASSPGPLVESWYAHVTTTLRHLPRIKAVIQWSSTDGACDYRLLDSPAAMAGFVAASNSRYVLGLNG